MPSSPYVSRINQIDAAQLDSEIYSILKTQIHEITKPFPHSSANKYQPELNALLKLIIWNYSLRTGSSSFAQQLLNLNYSNYSKKKSILQLILTIIPNYVQDRVSAKSIKFLANFAQLLALLNLLAFLSKGNQPHLTERILGIRNASTSVHKPREIGYSYMTRELLWHGLIELFTVGLPMVNLHYAKQRFMRFLSQKGERGGRAEPSMGFGTKCPDCGEKPNLPRHAGCEHVFCYYCMKAHFTADESFQCADCGEELRACDMKTLL